MNLPAPSKGSQTRQTILDAAHSLFLEHGYAATSMRQIAGRAGLALGGIYNHFSGKDDIFQALILDRHPYVQIFPLLKNVPGDSAEEFIRNAAVIIQAEMGSRPEFMKLMFIEIVEFNGSHFPKLFDVLYQQILPILQRFQSPQSGARDLPALLILRTLMGTIVAYYVTEFLMNDPAIPAALRSVSLADFMEIYLHGILKPPTS
ncbi:MAG: hypothetical protein CO094_12020 [Anaerolineae bacterium CG_4_9_14_3_um_filter_57_17]|nr:TetR/AcrR family transcriptional regulator [bacterium]NCT20292.1 TetR/AcrR family transcriptional regulator [bacterium]OIO84770.1 MAG: hypothetical protein AUK01_08120 [Anaerolineae bacterium CG2_30_57_67]PJB64703.1 MAG: hypothetical protein CO094_12020 [Anaerolineae bacterium CG_4_9_14_3_um_filter_57_17]